jgi:hypothetical protein
MLSSFKIIKSSSDPDSDESTRNEETYWELRSYKPLWIFRIENDDLKLLLRFNRYLDKDPYSAT